MIKIKTLEDFNSEMFDIYNEQNYYPKLNGIECPDCKSELMDADDILLTSYPPKKRVICSNCNYRGYRIV